MPTYSTPRHGISQSDALLEAAAIAPVADPILHTFEFFHSLGTPGGAIYVVQDLQPLFATKEATADRDAGLVVEFLASSIGVGPAEESDGASDAQATLTASNVSGVLSAAVKRARGSLESWVVIERLYSASDTSAPAQMPPSSFLISNIDIDGELATLSVGYGDPGNVSVPNTTFKRSEYPGLVR